MISPFSINYRIKVDKQTKSNISTPIELLEMIYFKLTNDNKNQYFKKDIENRKIKFRLITFPSLNSDDNKILGYYIQNFNLTIKEENGAFIIDCFSNFYRLIIIEIAFIIIVYILSDSLLLLGLLIMLSVTSIYSLRKNAIKIFEKLIL
jgi:hypothetical protein